ncbi:Fe2+-dependent dioxygenase [Fodinicurvata sediminis]|uniref:Fe2+-dependent dioxygenase n=1 Tax=Fodinicurvata sediminis TaxID=1121832 RepID=UPI0003B65599|nr:Fe2+-dependent dioxygenase [Fodinicurvata sediminis]
MLYVIDNILSTAECQAMREAMDDPALFEDGRNSAGWHARQVKKNRQLKGGAQRDGVVRKVEQALSRHVVFRAAAWPKRFVKLLASRYEPGMEYGLHVDDALMGGQRTDLSFTLFLSDPQDYSGGELMITESSLERAVKLPVGQLVLYPSDSLHRVAPVEEGLRLAVVGWVRSYIRRDDQRAILFDLETSLKEVYQREGKSSLFDRLARTRSNLLRQWCDD